MKKLSLIIGIVIIALIAIVVYQNSHNNDSFAAKASSTEQAKSRERVQTDVSSSHESRSASALARRTTVPKRESKEVDDLKRENEALKGQLEKISRPLGQDVLSSTVNCEIKPGETLLTGGYMTADGNYEMTLMTPSSVTLDDGTEGIKVSARVLSVGSDFVSANGLETLATNARNTLQHGEAWKQDDVAKTLQAASKTGGADMCSMPSVIARPSQPFTLSVGEAGRDQITIDGTVTRSPNGSYAIQSRVERTLKVEDATMKGQPATSP
jgi:hypothetical protein